jgi:TolA-binding protein
MRADYDYRLDQLEKGGGGKPPPRPSTPAGPTVSPGSTAAAPSGGLGGSGDQAYHDAFRLLQDGDYAGAERGFRAFVQRNPQSQLAGSAEYWLGETYYARRDYAKAQTAYAEGYKTYQSSPDIYTLSYTPSLHDALPIWRRCGPIRSGRKISAVDPA